MVEPMAETMELMSPRQARERHPQAFAQAAEQMVALYRDHGILYVPMHAHVSEGGTSLEITCSLETPREGLCDMAMMSIPLVQVH